MYIQIKKSNNTEYVYLVEAFRKEDGSIGHNTIKKLGRLDNLIKDDPDALEKLKKEVKEKSAQLRGAIIKKEVSKISSMVSHSLINNYDNGLPQISYANVLIGHIWSSILKLEYRLGYLQTRYYTQLPYSLSDVLLVKTVIDLLDLDNQDSDLHYGDELGFLGVDYDYEHVYEYFEHAQEILNEESLQMLRFIVKQLSTEYGLDFLNSGMTQLSLHFDQDFLKILDISKGGLTINADELVHSKGSRFKQIFSYLRMIIMKLIRFKLMQKYSESYEYSQIKTALREAILLVDYPLDSNGSFLYIKRNNGRNVALMNKILAAFDMVPLLNIQDRVELGHRLHFKFKHETQVVPSFIYEKVHR